MCSNGVHSLSQWPALNERAVLPLADQSVRSVSVRVAPTVHGSGDNGLMPMIVAADRAAGTAAYIGDGASRWPAVAQMVNNGAAEELRMRLAHRTGITALTVRSLLPDR
jgi:hypothetical protein